MRHCWTFEIIYLFEIICSSGSWSADNKVWVTLGPEVTICQFVSLEANFNHRLTQSHNVLSIFSSQTIRIDLDSIEIVGSYQSFQN